ncbi:nucleotidyltransferase family protein [Pelagibacterium luteolum]|uniref:Nucleotidyltransferase n=1 Tax=Pelagibacterium luteolum TaxID=440168 RepID=A0A1G7WZG0_9HYPH|nr:nucleotidyltransferase family protein [Pelagibacterium luteolum]SDG77286.1 hypothetical protein SAMN04487974_1082 [Pelagibacterium luteolum]
MSGHLRYSGLSDDEQHRAVQALVGANTELLGMLTVLRDMNLPDAWIVSGAVYQNIWNALTGRPLWTGVKDIDVIYFDDTDLGYEAEDRVIREVDERLPMPPVPIEVRNQARVHLWFAQKFGFEVPSLESSLGSLLRYASRSHAVAVRLEGHGELSVAAPFGLDDILSFRVTPNAAYGNRVAHEEKGRRAQAVWPEISVVPWPVTQNAARER